MFLPAEPMIPLAILSVIIAMRGAQNKVAAEGIQTSDVLKSLEDVQSDPDLRVHPTGSVAINRNVWRWNVCAIICFMMGIFCLGVFVGWNLFESKKASCHRGISSQLQHRQKSNLYAYTAPPVTK